MEDDIFQQIYLLPGTLYCSDCSAEITTTLGSCVSVVIYDTITKKSGMNHYMLPYVCKNDISFKYGDVSISYLIKNMKSLCGKLHSFEAKIFGGSCVLDSYIGKDICLNNIKVAEEYLEKHNIPIVSKYTGGNIGLNIKLNTDTGDVYLRKINSKDIELF